MNLYGFVAASSNVVTCDYYFTNICYPSGFTGCKTGAVECTEDHLKKIEKIRNGLDSDECWAAALGYECCNEEESTHIYFTDADGKWGVNSKNEWCGIINAPEAKCFAENYGYKCCSSSEYYVLTDELGRWGIENNEWCGLYELPKNI